MAQRNSDDTTLAPVCEICISAPAETASNWEPQGIQTLQRVQAQNPSSVYPSQLAVSLRHAAVGPGVDLEFSLFLLTCLGEEYTRSRLNQLNSRLLS